MPFRRKPEPPPDPCPCCVNLEMRRVAALEALVSLVASLIDSNAATANAVSTALGATTEALNLHRHRLERLDGRLNRLELWAEAWGEAHPDLVPPYPSHAGPAMQMSGMALVPTHGGIRR